MANSSEPGRGTGSRRALIAFWGCVVAVVAIGAGILQYLGPPKAVAPASPAPVAVAPPAHAPAGQMAASAPPAIPAPSAVGTGSTLPSGAPIAGPNPALLGPALSNPGWLVPRVSAQGLTPMRAYAAAAPAAAGPHVAILVAGLGDDDAQSQRAIDSLPAAISLALTPYGAHIADIAALARASGHELILEMPMQGLNPQAENAGNEALVMAGPITLDQPMLDWNFSQLRGYAGVTDAIGTTQGAGFMSNANAKAWLLQQIADKGLFFIDARPTGIAPYAWSRGADVVIDPVGAPQAESAQLTSLTELAKLHGSALGILMVPAPDSIASLQSWAQALGPQGVTLVPVSALVLPPTSATAAPGASP